MSVQQTIGNYRLISVLGQGGMGTVYRAVHAVQGHTVALKVLAPHLSHDPAFVRRFWDEYQTVHGLYHPNIVRVYEFGEDHGRYFIAAEYIAGTSLERRLAQGRALSLRETVYIVQQIAAALDAVHPRGVVHRDLKPSNVLIEHGRRVALTDFGIASIGGGHDGQVQQRGWWGTPEYMAPEQAQGDMRITHKADIYALGIVTYQMLTGHVPFQRDVPMATLHAHIHETPPPLRAMPGGGRISVGVEQVVMQALQKDPHRRPQRAGDFARALAVAAGVRAPNAPPGYQVTPLLRGTPGSLPPLQKASRQQPMWPIVLAAAGVMLLIVVLLAFTLPRSSQSSSRPETLAYVCEADGESRICIQDATGHRWAFPWGTRDWAPIWSPDGQHIAFASDREGNTDIWILEPEANTVYRFTTSGQASASGPAWSPDGQSIVFDKELSAGSYDIYIQQMEGSAPTRLTWNSTLDSDPAWSPDGQQIAFVSDRDGDLEIYLMDTRGQNVIRLTNHTGRDFAPVWSPDGKRIASECADGAGGDTEICVMDADGSNPRALTDNAVDDRQPAWSPDGQRIAFCRTRSDGSAWDIWVMDGDGANQRVWVQDGYSNTHPSWKP